MIYENKEIYEIDEMLETIREMARKENYKSADEYVGSGWFERDMIQRQFEGFSDPPTLGDIRELIETVEQFIDAWKAQPKE